MPFDHNDHYHRLVLRQVPAGCRRALDVGCGTGRLARRMAARGIEVDAVDPSPEVIAQARRAGGGPEYRVADVTGEALPRGHYDAVTCLASLHHMPFGTVTALREALAPGGVLVVLGCYPERSPLDHVWSLAAVPVNAAARLAVAASELRRPAAERTPGVRAPVRTPTMSYAQTRREAARLLPGARLRRLLFWRYLLVYRAPRPAPPSAPRLPERAG
ncbi:class I SAM-dependent methyltransferase [Streptomyces sp. ICBB 8177]|uniref:class I SAM-dependent methyltransferase n=1 Tax=Streptomyces sp. ICBB 8177 TaxID=563922 RepID=UPI000D6751AD|nr:class I SAM-dependent methyltransferase [Streptomyces sp. ICBB 8177]PWI45342.1 SAM-dependent methyltransferase [Streptomyces sp. ICBB 8177]